MKKHPTTLIVRIDIHIPTGQSGIWAAARCLRAFTAADIAARVQADDGYIRDYLGRLVKGGYLSRVDGGPGKPHQYALKQDQAAAPRLLPDGGPLLDRRGAGQDNMWRAAKMLRDFDAEEISRAAACDGVTVAVSAAAAYLRRLFAAGYLIVTSPAKQSGKGRRGLTRYALDPRRNSGPQAPQIMRTKAVYDPNNGAVYSLPEPAEQVLP